MIDTLLCQLIIDKNIVYSNNYNLDLECFTTDQKNIYNTIIYLIDKNVTPSAIAIANENKEISPLAISKITSKTPTAANWKYYHDEINKQSKTLKIKNLVPFINDLLKTKNEPNFLISEIEKKLSEIELNSKTEIINFKDYAIPFLENVQNIIEMSREANYLPGISTGWPQLDDTTLGFQNDHFYLIGGRPSTGKSALIFNFISNIMFNKNIGIGLFSAESSINQVSTRMYSSKSKVYAKKIKTGFLSTNDMHALLDTGDQIQKTNLFVYDKPNISFLELKKMARIMVKQKNVKIIFIDYIQLIQWHDKKLPKHEQIENVSLGLKELNRELNVPIVAAAQLTRDTQNKEPELNSFRYSGQLEQDADDVWFIHRFKNKEGNEQIKLLVKKGRDTGTGEVDIYFNENIVTFYEKKVDNNY